MGTFSYINGDILKSDVYCHDQVNTATEYGALIDNGYVIFNDTDVKEMKSYVMKIVNGSSAPTSVKYFQNQKQEHYKDLDF